MNYNYFAAVQGSAYGENQYGSDAYGQFNSETSTPSTTPAERGGPLANTGYDVIILAAFVIAFLGASTAMLFRRLRARSKSR